MQNPFEEVIHRMQIMQNQIVKLTEEVSRMKDELKVDPKRISFTLEEAATSTGLSYHTLYNMSIDGRLETSQPGGEKGKKLVEREELLRVLRETRTTPKLKIAR
jgi:hypothetical protein